MARHVDTNQHRRAFVARAAAALAVPWALTSCRRDSGAGPGQVELPGPVLGADGVVRSRAERPADELPRPPITEPTVRVCIRQSREGEGSIVIGPRSKWLRVGPAEAPEQSVVFRAPIELRLNMDSWSVRDELGFRWSLGPRQSVQVDAMPGEEKMLDLAGQRYPGLMRLVPRSDAGPTSFDVVSHVAVEAYLPGVLARELYNHWQVSTHMAQAVAARSFACCEAQWFATRRHYDMTNTQASQAYVGAVSHEKSLAAVRATRGQMLGYRGLLVSGYYSSCCGGLAASAADAIGPNPINAMPPLEGRPGQDVCTGAPVYRWTTRQPRAMLSKRLRAFAQQEGAAALLELRDLRTIEVSARNPHGRPVRYVLTDMRGATAELGAETLRRAVNFSGAPDLAAPPQPLRSSNVHAVVDVAAGIVEFKGQGFGHGVGLCQHGAEALAKAGASHDRILAWYYPNAAIVATYS